MMENKPELNIDDIVSEETVESTEEEEVVENTEEIKPKRKRKNTTKKVEEELKDKTCECSCEESSPRNYKTWKEVFKENYDGKSEEAKALEPFLKNTYKGDVYIPWAVMERLVYMCDENAKFTNICNPNGGLVHSDMLINHQINTQKGEVISETEAPMFSHFVKVALEFMGKVFIEDYPIQDQDYAAAKIFNQNLVNRALQRAKAKVGARATGLGLRLYEGMDLQFDSPKEDKKPELVNTQSSVKIEPKKEENAQKIEKTVQKTPEKIENTPINEENNKKTVKTELTDEQKATNIIDGGQTEAYINDERAFEPQDIKIQEANQGIMELVNLIKNTPEERITPVLQRVNISIMKKYSFALSTTDTEEELIKKVSKFPNPEQFKKTINNLLG